MSLKGINGANSMATKVAIMFFLVEIIGYMAQYLIKFLPNSLAHSQVFCDILHSLALPKITAKFCFLIKKSI